MSVDSTSLYCLAPSVRTAPFDVTAHQPRFLLEVGEVGEARRFEVTAGVQRVIEALRQGPCTLGELVERLRDAAEGQLTEEKVAWLLQSALLPRRIAILHAPTGALPAGTPEAPPPAASFLGVRVRLFGADRLRALTSALGGLFRPAVVLPVLVLAAAAYLATYPQLLSTVRRPLDGLSVGEMALVLVVLNVAALGHELGHAAACRHYGLTPGDIGWGVYLAMFVLYADASAAWRLPRRQRAVVDLGGVYFELALTLVLLAAYRITAQPLLAYCVAFINLRMLTSLNPFLRQDGYWMLVDLAGQPNLQGESIQALRFAWRRLTGRRCHPPDFLTRPRWLQITVFAYTALSLLLSLALLAWLARWLVVELVPDIRRTALGLRHLGAHGGPLLSWSAAAAILRLLLEAVFTGLVGLTGWRFVHLVVRPRPDAAAPAGTPGPPAAREAAP